MIIRGIPRAYHSQAMAEDQNGLASRASADVVVLGAGPAGLVLGNLLVAAGIDCVVLERATRPHIRTRARAGFLAPNTVRILERHGLADGLHRDGRSHGACEFRTPDGGFRRPPLAAAGRRPSPSRPRRELARPARPGPAQPRRRRLRRPRPRLRRAHGPRTPGHALLPGVSTRHPCRRLVRGAHLGRTGSCSGASSPLTRPCAARSSNAPTRSKPPAVRSARWSAAPVATTAWDLHMMCNVGGRERSAEHYARLLGDAGLELLDRTPLPLEAHVLHARKTPWPGPADAHGHPVSSRSARPEIPGRAAYGG
ncbi:FAD-dependent monooxygenase [Streptomyces sp. NPDC052494]|uniref:FAD-dependent monooxygenase n=1 Tax=Streptomyces sp. NPDC052494 TaxID=3365692 RepID=UPI0037D0BF2A